MQVVNRSDFLEYNGIIDPVGSESITIISLEFG